MCGLNDLSCAYEIFPENFTLIYDKCFLLRTMKARRFSLREPWFTKGLAKSKRKKYKLYKSFPNINTRNSSTENADNSYHSFVIHFELQSAYIMKKKNLKNLNQMLRPRGEF